MFLSEKRIIWTATIKRSISRKSLLKTVKAPKQQRGVNLLIDIENSIKAAQSRGYEQWAKIAEIQTEGALKTVEKRIADMAVLIKNISACQKTKPVYEAYRKAPQPKTKAGIRDIPVIEQVYDVLKTEYKAQQERGFPTPTISGMTGFIFVNEEGRLCSQGN